jgi:hypothetical protein
MEIMKYVMYTCNVYIVYHFYFPEAFLQVKKLINWLPSGDSAENFFGNIISTRLKYTILKPKDIGK